MSVRIPMPKPSRLLPTMAFALGFVLLAGRPVGTAAPSPTLAGSSPMLAANLDAEKREGEKLASKLATHLGPLAPVALSPFFALTCLSGASLAAKYDVPLLSGVKNNPILGANSALNNEVVFLGLLGLSLLTAAPKLTKVTKPFAQAVDQIEAHAGIIAIIAVQFLSKINFDGDAVPAAAIVFQAGIISFSSDVLLAVVSAINIFVVNTVKFFFEVLIWVSPIPTIDAMFEAANKACAAFLVGLYVWSPWVATIINLFIFAICLLLFAWARRRAIYMRGVLGDPVLGWFAEKIFRRTPATLTSTPLPSSITAEIPARTLVLKAFAGTAVTGVKRKVRGFLIQNHEKRLVFARPRLLRKPLLVPLPEPGAQSTVEKGLLSNSIILPGAEGEAPVTVIITRRYNALIDQIREVLGVAAAAPVSEDTTLEASRALGAAAKSAARREELRAELA